MIKLSILIPTIRKHNRFFTNLLSELRSQMLPYSEDIEIIVDDNEDDSIGVKRNRLLDRATGKYVTFIDSDDALSPNYIELLMKGIESDCDCLSLKGFLTMDGVDDGIFEHSLKYNDWRTTGNEVKYERFPNHLNTIRSSIAKQFKFTDKTFGEDFDWSTDIHKSGLLQTEHYIPEIIYFYRFLNKK